MAEADLKIPETIEHRYHYDQEYISDILRSVKTIAMVGASDDKTKFSYGVLRQLNEIGYEILPVTSNLQTTEIRGLKVYRSLQEIDRPIDMVDVFRPKEELYGLAEQAISIGAKVLWGQIGVYDDRAAALAEAAGLRVVMDRCPKIELFRPFWKPRLDLELNLPDKPGHRHDIHKIARIMRQGGRALANLAAHITLDAQKTSPCHPHQADFHHAPGASQARSNSDVPD